MSNTPIPVQNYDINRVVTNVQIMNVNVSLFNTATINVCLCDANNNTLDVRTVTLTPEEYSNWLADDNYLVQITLQKLGLTPASN